MAIEARYFEAGSCKHPGFSVMRGGGLAPRRFPSLVVALRHPREGWLLFDSGYSHQFEALTRHWPMRVYALTTPVTLPPGASAAEQLKAAGIDPSEVRHVLVSHFHADHIGGLRDFPNARFICMRAAWDEVKDLQGLRALREGFLRGSLPDDFVQRCRFVETSDLQPLAALAGRFNGLDLFGDGLLHLVHLPGHAAGQAGLLFDNTLLISDAAWLIQGLRERRLPGILARLLMHDRAAYRDSFENLAQLMQGQDLTLVPSHCEETLRRLPGLGQAR